MARTATLNSVSPAQIEAAKQKAIELCRLAYAPQPVAGTMLCWKGRIARAMDLMSTAYAVGDEAEMAKLRHGIELLTKEAQKADSEAQGAASAYASLCARAVCRAEPLYEPCTCEGCALATAQEHCFAAEYALRKACFDLLKPYDATDRLPYLIHLMEKDTQRLWAMLNTIGKAQMAYADACEAFGKRPDWHKVLS